MIPPRIESVSIINNYVLEISYVNGEKRIYDMKPNLKHNYYKNLRNMEYFKKVKNVETTVEWPEGEDVDPNELYEKGKK